MAAVIAQFFGIIGVDMIPPANIEELIPYLLTVAVGLFLVGAGFKVVAHIAGFFINSRRF